MVESVSRRRKLCSDVLQNCLLPARTVSRSGRSACANPASAEHRSPSRVTIKAKILIADDHPIVREGLRRIISREPDLSVEGEADDSEQALELALGQDWDLLVLDLILPPRGGVEVLKRLRRERSDLPVLIVSVHPEDEHALGVLREGASGYLSKEAPAEQLIAAIRSVVGGGKYISPTLAEKLAFGLVSQTAEPLRDILSSREFEVMRLLVGGKSVTEIANDLSLSVKTISTHRHRMLTKLNLHNSAELIRFAIERHVFD